VVVKSLPWPIEIDGSKLSFYRNIVHQNVSCEKGLKWLFFTDAATLFDTNIGIIDQLQIFQFITVLVGTFS